MARPVAPTVDDPVLRSASELVGGPAGSRSAGHPWWTPARVVLAVACLAWLLAMVQKAPCARDHWSGANSRYAQMCYSDVPFLYLDRGFAERRVPYADTGGRYPELEYPVLTGWFAYASTVVDHVLHGWPDVGPRRAGSVDALRADPEVEVERRDLFPVTALLLAPFVLLSAWFLSRTHRNRPWDALGFAAAPVLVLSGLVNWDLLAVTATCGALWAWARGRPALAGVLIGLGTAAKLYPVFLLGPLLVVALRQRRSGGSTSLAPFSRALLAAAITWVLVNAPVWAYGFDGWKTFWTFNADRGADLGSLWLVASLGGHPSTPHTINLVSWVFFGAVCVLVLLLGLAAPVVPRVSQLAFLVLVGFLVVNKVYSPQYVLWLLPLAVLARPRWRDLLIWQAGEVFYFAMVWLYLGGFTASGTSHAQDPAYPWAIVLRVAAELYLAAVVVRDVMVPARDPVLSERGSGRTSTP
jgi:uncharacterized membrane protein